MMADRVALGIQYRAGASLYRVRMMKPAVKRKLTGERTPHSELTAVRDMAAPVVMAPNKLLHRLLTPRKKSSWLLSML